MTKAELREYIEERDIYVPMRASKDELQAIYDRLIVHEKPSQPGVRPPAPPAPPAPPRFVPPAPVAPTEPVEPVEPEPVEPIEPEPVEPIEPEPVEPTEPVTEPVIEPANSFDELLGKIGSAKTPEPPKGDGTKPFIGASKRKHKRGDSSPDETYLSGYILLLITDTVFPFTFAFLNNIMDKKLKIDSGELQLSENDWGKLEPLADQAANYMSMSINPVAGFLLVAMFMYGNNLIALRMTKAVR